MFHCPYLLHKFVINYFFDCVPRLFELLTALLEYLNLLQRGCSPLALPHDCDYEIYNIAAQPYYCWWTHSWFILHRNNRTVCLFIVWEEDTSLPAMFNLLCSSTNQLLFKRTFVIKVPTLKITDNLIEAIMCLPLNWHLPWWTKMNGTQRRAVLSPWRMHCMYSGMEKGTSESRAEVTSNSEKIKARSLSQMLLSYASLKALGRQTGS